MLKKKTLSLFSFIGSITLWLYFTLVYCCNCTIAQVQRFCLVYSIMSFERFASLRTDTALLPFQTKSWQILQDIWRCLRPNLIPSFHSFPPSLLNVFFLTENPDCRRWRRSASHRQCSETPQKTHLSPPSASRPCKTAIHPRRHNYPAWQPLGYQHQQREERRQEASALWVHASTPLERVGGGGGVLQHTWIPSSGSPLVCLAYYLIRRLTSGSSPVFLIMGVCAPPPKDTAKTETPTCCLLYHVSKPSTFLLRQSFLTSGHPEKWCEKPNRYFPSLKTICAGERGYLAEKIFSRGVHY